MPRALDDGPFFHGTVAQLGHGDLLTAGRRSNYRPEVVMNHVYFTALVDGAGLAAEIAAELQPGGATPRVYRVEPTGAFENDPNVTDKKFPGNPTRSYRSSAPLRVLAEVDGWKRVASTHGSCGKHAVMPFRRPDGLSTGQALGRSASRALRPASPRPPRLHTAAGRRRPRRAVP